jgi:hypothetical protein
MNTDVKKSFFSGHLLFSAPPVHGTLGPEDQLQSGRSFSLSAEKSGRTQKKIRVHLRSSAVPPLPLPSSHIHAFRVAQFHTG